MHPFARQNSCRNPFAPELEMIITFRCARRQARWVYNEEPLLDSRTISQQHDKIIKRGDAFRIRNGIDKAKTSIVTSSPDILGGALVFNGTRFPVSALFDYLAAGDSLERFLNYFPTVKREQAVALLESVEQQF
jgi:uncharacterized protein (DUF433 family)